MLSLSNFRNSLLTMANSFFFRRLVISKQNVYTEKGIQDISPTLILLKNDCFIPPIWLIQSVPVTTNIVGLNPVCQWQAPGRWFSPGTLVSSINKSYRHDTIEILLKVALDTINQTKPNLLPLNRCRLADKNQRRGFSNILSNLWNIKLSNC